MTKAEWEAVASRLEFVVDCLTNRAVAATISMDRRIAARAIDYCRSRAAGAEENPEREVEITEFLRAHNQSLDWVLLGDASGMICARAEGTGSIHRPILRIVH